MTDLTQDTQERDKTNLVKKVPNAQPAKMSNTNMTYVGVFKEIFDEERYRVKDYKSLDKEVVESIRQNHKNFNPSIFTTMDDLRDLGLGDFELESTNHFGVKMEKLYSNGNVYETEVVSQGLRDVPGIDNLKEGDYICLLNIEKGSNGDRIPNRYQLTKFESEQEMKQAARHYNLVDKMRLSIVQDYNSALKQNDAYTPAFIEMKENQANINLDKLNLVNFVLSLQSREDRDKFPSPPKKDYDAFKLAVQDCALDESCKKDGKVLINTLINTLSDYGVSTFVTDGLKKLSGEPASDSLFAEFAKTHDNIGVVDKGKSKEIGLGSETSQSFVSEKKPRVLKSPQPKQPSRKQEKANDLEPDEDELVQGVQIPPIMQSLASLASTSTPANQVTNAQSMPFGLPQRQSNGFSFNLGGFNSMDVGNTAQPNGAATEPLYQKVCNLMLDGGSAVAARIKDIPFDDIKENIKVQTAGLAESVKEVFDVGAWLLTKNLTNSHASTEREEGGIPFLSPEQRDMFFSTMQKNGLYLENLGEDRLRHEKPFATRDGVRSNLDNANFLVDKLEEQYMMHETNQVADTLKELDGSKEMNPANKAQTLLAEQDIVDSVLKSRKDNDFNVFKDKAIQNLKDLQKHTQEAFKAVVDFINNLFSKSRDGSGPSPS